MILNRYLSKEILTTFSAVTLVLLGVALSNRFVVYLAKSANGQLPTKLVMQVVLLYIPELLATLMPAAFFAAILFAQGRLHADSEFTALNACGVGWGRITKIVLSLAVVVSLFVSVLTLVIVPQSTYLREQVIMEGESMGVMHALQPGQFHVIDDGRLVFYFEEKEGDHQMHDVFIASLPSSANLQNQDWSTIWAERAHLSQDPESKAFYLVLNDGKRYTGTPGNLDYTEIHFQEYGRELIHEPGAVPNFHRLRSSLDLVGSDNPGEQAELQWRLSIPLSLIVLALLALPLAEVKPREGRFAKIIPAILLYIVYYNCLTISRRYVGKGVLSSFVGVWWVHILFGILGILLLMQTSGWLRARLNYANS